MVRLTFLEKTVRISIGNIHLFAYSIFKKNVKFYCVKDSYKVNQNCYPRQPVTLKLQCKKNGLPNFPGMKFVFQSEISTYSPIIFSKNREILLGQVVVQSELN